ncbi:MAG: FKBP-type peptidyl-prolyl cis-trans isomerase [Candidatus Caldarchaeum sp.]
MRQQLAERVTKVNTTKPPYEERCEGPQRAQPDLAVERSKSITEVKILDIEKGTGPLVQPELFITINYCMRIPDGPPEAIWRGTVVDTNKYAGGRPYRFKIGEGEFPKALYVDQEPWFRGMRVGGRRVIILPASQAYGADPPPGVRVPKNCAVVLEVDLLFVGHLQ